MTNRNKSKKEDEWIAGYMCAVATMIRMEGGANTDTAELFRACCPLDDTIRFTSEIDLRIFVQHGLIKETKAVKARLAPAAPEAKEQGV